MPKFNVTLFYRAKQGFTVEAESAEEAKRIVLEGDPGDQDYDETLGHEAIEVYAEDEDTPVLNEEL